MRRIRNFLFKNQTTLQTIAKNTFWLYFGNIAGRLIRAVLIIYAARLLGAEGYGVFSYALGFAALFNVLGDVGIDSVVIREIAKAKNEEKRIVAAGYYLKLALNAASYLFILSAIPLAPVAESRILIPFLGLAFVFDALRQFGFAIAKAIEKTEIEAGAYIAHQTVGVVLGFAALIAWRTPFALAVAYALGGAFGFLVIVHIFRRYFRGISRYFDWNAAKRIFADAWPFAFTGLTAVILTNTDTVMLGWFASAEQIGYYSAALRPVQLLFVVPAMLAAAALPALSRKAELREGQNATEKLLTAVNLLALPAAIGGFLVPDTVIRLLYGSEYVSAAVPFQILIWVVIFNFPATIMGHAVLAHNKQKETIKFFVIAAAVNIVLNYLFIPQWGIAGSAFATLIAQGIAAIGYYIVLRKVEPVRFFPNMKKIFAANAAMAAGILLLQALHAPFWVVLLLGAALYIAALTALKEPLLKELRGMFAG